MNVHDFIFTVAYQYHQARLKRCSELQQILTKTRTREAFIIHQACALLVTGKLDMQSSKIAQTIVSAQGKRKNGKKNGVSSVLFIFDSWLGLLWGAECLSKDSVKFEPGYFDKIHQNAQAASVVVMR